MCENLHVAGLGPKVAQHHSYIPLESKPVSQDVFPKGKANGYPTEAFLWLGMTLQFKARSLLQKHALLIFIEHY